MSADVRRLRLLACCALLTVASACGSDRSRERDRDDVAPAAGRSRFIPVDTSRLTALPYAYQLENAFPQLNFGNQRPLQLLYAPDGTSRVFVLCQNGKVHAFENREDEHATDVFLDLSTVVSRSGNEEGLLGLAFHPEYAENGEFFVCYSTEGPKTVVSRFRVSADDPARGDADSEEVLLTIDQPFRTQNGGSLEFGPDGYLYIGLGDGGSANDPQGHGQDLTTLLGSVLRIDVDSVDGDLPYAIPSDNPFVGRGDEARGEIWAYGFRNVWRLAFDRETGQLWGGDVGQDRYEEVNLIVKGGNYGWNQREGRHPLEEADNWGFFPTAPTENDGTHPPVTEYFHSEGRAVVGGRVYRGSRLPELHGAYLYADFVTGNVWALRYDSDERQVTSDTQICSSKAQIAGFGEDRDGEVYLCAFDGNIYRLRENADYLLGGEIRFPARLSETGLFESTAELRPVPGMIPYSVNVPLWSDHASKERYVALPAGGQVQFSETGQWEFPQGSVIVKTFSLDMKRDDPSTQRRLETRLLVNSPYGWEGYTYLWNDEQTDAFLSDVATTESFEIETGDGATTQHWYYPGRSDCKACHTAAGGFVLSLNTRQLNRDHDYGEGPVNQIAALAAMGVFSAPLPEDAATWEAYPEWSADASSPDENERLVRAYLDVNCAFCHAPGGPGNSPIDLRYHTPLERMALIGVPPRGTRSSREPASFLVSPGRPRDSELLLRMELRGPGQMPVLASTVADTRALQRIADWIAQLQPSGR
ncbi:MAG: hypothetical protein DWQ34_15140 [Planctomycetota bacterium]|nr:MAG: hypothetical protein DWQ34_15140 [Planctomycetota bacterium]REK31290.1 MAG: hypothetical protein DWQ41_00095 [Planctomycetota bacterium]REK37320.1 MAG: hypothetical protein DWQ45_07700 [Planctomycetota bacterium]